MKATVEYHYRSQAPNYEVCLKAVYVKKSRPETRILEILVISFEESNNERLYLKTKSPEQKSWTHIE